MARRSLRRLSESELEQLLESDDPFTLAVKGSVAVEAVLDIAISEALPNPHLMEIRALKPALKLDLAVALGLIPSDVRAALQRLNRIRNEFAHENKEEFTTRDARQLRDLWPVRMREVSPSAFDVDPPLGVLRSSLGIAVFLFEARVTEIRDDKVRQTALSHMVKEALLPYKDRPVTDDGKSRTERLEEEVARARAERQERGEL